MKKILLTLTIVLFSLGASADSPLTSTTFYTVYEEYEIVQKTLLAHNHINTEIMMYLSDKSYPIDIKMAVINALGWQFEGLNNYDDYLNFIEIQSGLDRKQDDFYKKIDADEILCLAYLKAMDNYFEVGDAKRIAEIALAKSRRTQRSYTYNLIDALIGAQIQLRGDWCKLYKTTQAVKENFKLKNDFAPEAEKIVFEYMDLYKAECK